MSKTRSPSLIDSKLLSKKKHGPSASKALMENLHIYFVFVLYIGQKVVASTSWKRQNFFSAKETQIPRAEFHSKWSQFWIKVTCTDSYYFNQQFVKYNRQLEPLYKWNPHPFPCARHWICIMWASTWSTWDKISTQLNTWERSWDRSSEHVSFVFITIFCHSKNEGLEYIAALNPMFHLQKVALWVETEINLTRKGRERETDVWSLYKHRVKMVMLYVSMRKNRLFVLNYIIASKHFKQMECCSLSALATCLTPYG